MKQIILQKILDKQGNSDDDETVSSAASSSPPKPEDFKILRIHMNCDKRTARAYLLAKCKVQKIKHPARVNWLLAKVNGNYFNKVILLQVKQTMSAKLLKTKHYSSTVPPLTKAKIMASTFGYFRQK